MPYKVLCVDDDAGMRGMFELLQANPLLAARGVTIETAGSGAAALAALTSRGPFAVVLSDLHMPGMDGIQFLTNAREIAPDTVRLMLTGYAELQVVMDAINEGNVFRFLTKPCVPGVLAKVIVAGVDQHRLLASEKELLEQTVAGSIKVLTEVLSLTNPTAFGRASRVQRLVRRLALILKAGELWQVEVAALLSQLGCLAVPEDVLRKARGGVLLSADEERMLAGHPRLGRDLIAAIPRLSAVAEIIGYQNKRFDGAGGTADDKRGADIPFGARILKVALDFDDLDARGVPRAEALQLLGQREGCYDSTVLDALGNLFATERPDELREVRLRDICEHLDKIRANAALRNGMALLSPLGHMVLAEDVLSLDDILLLSKGQELTDHLVDRLRNLSRRIRIREPIKVLVPAVA